MVKRGNWEIVKLAPSIFPITVAGTEKHVYDLGRVLVAKGHHVKVFTQHGNYEIESDGQVNLIEKASVTKILGRLLAEQNDVIHLHGMGLGLLKNALALSVMKLRRKKIVFTPHGVFERLDEYRKKSIKYKAYARFAKMLPLKLIDAYICVYPAQKDLLHNSYGIPADKITFVPNAIPEQTFDVVDSAAFRKKHNLEGKRILCYLGRLHPIKRVSDIVEVMVQLHSAYGGDVVLLIIGPGGEDQEHVLSLIRQFKLEESVLLLGEIGEEEKIQALSCTDVFVTASSHEAFGISVCEAMAQGVPVVSANNQGATFLLGDGQYGLLYEIGDKQQLLEKVSYLLNNPEKAKEIGEKGRERAREFNWEEVAAKVERIYADLIG